MLNLFQHLTYKFKKPPLSRGGFFVIIAMFLIDLNLIAFFSNILITYRFWTPA